MEFPDWVQGPTLCKTRSFKLVMPTDSPHRARIVVASIKNVPLILGRVKKTGELATLFADTETSKWNRELFELVESDES